MYSELQQRSYYELFPQSLLRMIEEGNPIAGARLQRVPNINLNDQIRDLQSRIAFRKFKKRNCLILYQTSDVSSASLRFKKHYISMCTHNQNHALPSRSSFGRARDISYFLRAAKKGKVADHLFLP